MKSKAKLIAVLMAVLLFPILKVSADSDGYIVTLKDMAIPAELTNILTEVNRDHRKYTVDDLTLLEGFDKYIEQTTENEKLTLIDSAPNVGLLALPNDTYYSEQWQLQMVNAEFAWDLDTYGNDVNVGVIDTGCNAHEDLNVAGGYNFILNNDNYSDNHGHGTHVSGIISAQHNGIGVAGIAPKVNIYALKCVDPNYESGVDELIAAIYAAVDKYHCKVISMSLGILGNSTDLHQAVKHAVNNGAIVIAAVGNDGRKNYYKSRYWYPAAYNEVIGVGSISSSGHRSDFSQQNNSVFVCAPGENYGSTIGTADYGFMSGTSQATPIVSAAAAVLLSANPNMTVDEFKSYIISCSIPLSDSYCGYGLLNIGAMFKECIKNTPYYVSPITDDCVMIYNNTEKSFAANGIFAEYDGDAYVSGSLHDVVLLPYKRVRINYAEASEGALKFFLWGGQLRPLAESRISK